MNPTPFFACLLVTACAVAPAARLAPKQAPIMSASQDPFPLPKSGLALEADKDGPLTLAEVLTEFQRVTGVHVVATSETAATLSKVQAGLSLPLEIPPARVYSTVETLLSQNDYFITLLQTEEPIMIGIQSSLSKQMATRLWFTSAADIDSVADHPALMVSTMVTLQNVNVRDLSNSLRQMFQNPIVQQVIPMGGSNTVLLSGRGGEVAGLVRLLRTLDDEEGRVQAENEKREAQRPPVKKPNDAQPK
jgi:hypothetical protein